MHAAVAYITTGIQFCSGSAPARYCIIIRFRKPLWANVYALSKLLLVYHTPIQVGHLQDTRRRRDGVKQLPALPFRKKSGLQVYKIPLIYNGCTRKGVFQLTALAQANPGP